MSISHYIVTEKPEVSGWRVILLNGHHDEQEALSMAETVIQEMTGYPPHPQVGMCAPDEALISKPECLHASLRSKGDGEPSSSPKPNTLDAVISRMLDEFKTSNGAKMSGVVIGPAIDSSEVQVPVTGVQVAGDRLAAAMESMGLKMKAPTNWQHRIEGNA